MNNTITSFIRTWVPIAIGSVIAWLMQKYNIIIPQDLYAQAAELITALVIAFYYGIVRLIEVKVPWVGWLLGQAKRPVYVETTTDKVVEVSDLISVPDVTKTVT